MARRTARSGNGIPRDVQEYVVFLNSDVTELCGMNLAYVDQTMFVKPIIVYILTADQRNPFGYVNALPTSGRRTAADLRADIPQSNSRPTVSCHSPDPSDVSARFQATLRS